MRRVLLPVTHEITPTLIYAQVLKLQAIRVRIFGHDARVKVDEVGVIARTALGGANAVGIMAGRTGNPVVQVPSVLRKALITQYAVATVTVIAKGIGEVAFSRIIGGLIIQAENRCVHRPVRPFGCSVAGTVAVRAIDDTGHCEG